MRFEGIEDLIDGHLDDVDGFLDLQPGCMGCFEPEMAVVRLDAPGVFLGHGRKHPDPLGAQGPEPGDTGVCRGDERHAVDPFGDLLPVAGLAFGRPEAHLDGIAGDNHVGIAAERRGQRVQHRFGDLVVYRDVEAVHLIVDAVRPHAFVFGLHVGVLRRDHDGDDAAGAKSIRHGFLRGNPWPRG